MDKILRSKTASQLSSICQLRDVSRYLEADSEPIQWISGQFAEFRNSITFVLTFLVTYANGMSLGESCAGLASAATTEVC